MPQTFKIKSSSVEDKVPAAGDLATAELALNLKDQKLYSKDADGTVFEIGAAQDVSGFVKLDDGNTQQSITGGGGLDVAGPFDSNFVRINQDGTGPRQGIFCNSDFAVNTGQYALKLYPTSDLGAADGYSVIARGAGGETSIKAAGGWGPRYYFSATTSFISISNDNDFGAPNPITGGTAVVHVYNGLNTQFGTNAAQLGNVAPLNDWSCYPARTTSYSAPPVSPAPAPQPIDPEFGVDEPTFSGGVTGSAGMVGTQDIINLEGE